MKLEPGEQLGVWVVGEALGEGGMGTVYRCTHVEAPRLQAAVKVLGERLYHPTEAQQRFVREAEILGVLDHPHIVRFRGLRMDVPPGFMEMDYVEGTPLDEVIAAGPTPWATALDWMLQLASALAYLHDQGVRHRDVKPSNVIVTDAGHVVLVDFGLATDQGLERITEQGVSFGTVSYAPPEWMDPDRLDPVQWDLYAWAVIFHELLIGELAFPLSGEGPVRKQLLQVALGKQTAPPLDPGDGVPQAIRRILGRATQLEVRDRYADAGQIVADLQAVERGRGEEVVRRHDAPRRRRVWLAALGLVLTVAGTVGALAWWSAPVNGAAAVQLEPEVAPPQTGGILVTGPAGAVVRSGTGSRVLDGQGAASFAGRKPGTYALAWASPGCEACLDEGLCPMWCGHGSLNVTVRAAADAPVSLPAVPRRRLTIDVPAIEAGRPGMFRKKAWPLEVRVGAWRLAEVGPGRAQGEVPAGVHTAVVSVGTCTAEEEGCLPTDCPARCSSWTGPVTVSWEGTSVVTLSEIPAPRR